MDEKGLGRDDETEEDVESRLRSDPHPAEWRDKKATTMAMNPGERRKGCFRCGSSDVSRLDSSFNTLLDDDGEKRGTKARRGTQPSQSKKSGDDNVGLSQARPEVECGK